MEGGLCGRERVCLLLDERWMTFDGYDYLYFERLGAWCRAIRPVNGYDGVKLCDVGYNHVLLCTIKLIVI